MEIKPSVYSKEDIQDMSARELREACLKMVLVDRAYSSPVLPHREIQLFSREEVVGCTQALLLPGGERLLILHNSGSFRIHDIRTSKTVIDCLALRPEWKRTSSKAQLFPKSMLTGYIVLQVSGKECSC